MDTSTSSIAASNAVTGLEAAPGNANVGLVWNAVTGASSYTVNRALTSGGPYTAVATPTAGSYTDSGLSNGTTYFYVVAASVNGVTGPASPQVSATPVAPVAVPAPPTALVASNGISKVTLSWTASTSASAYYVKRATTSGGPYTVVGAPTTVGYVDAGLDAGVKFFYVVAAVNAAGESANSTEVSGSPLAPSVLPSVPTDLVAAAGVSQVNLVWGAATGATSYHLKRSLTTGGPYTVVATTTVTTAYVDATVTNGTTYFYVVSAMNGSGESANSAEANATPIAPDVVVTVDPTHTQTISPYIYGINDATTVSGLPSALTLDHSGGDRWTAYNWQTNASNSGSDAGLNYSNDPTLSASATPAEAVRSRIAADQAAGMASLVTFQLQGLASADEAGPVDVSNPPISDASRFVAVVDAKGAPFTATPSNSSGHIYMDEFAWNLDRLFSGQNIFTAVPTSQRTFVELDNQPELWNSTHLEVQGPNAILSDTFITRTTALAQALKTQFPNMMIFGPVNFGFSGIYTWHDEPALDATATPDGANWFADKYLKALKAASTTFGKPLVDVYDFHWFSEATDGSGNRVINLTGPTLTQAQIQAIVQSPRSLWDKTYSENSYIVETLGGPIYLLGRLQSKITAEDPGVKLALTDYLNGGGQHIAGTLAEADNLGLFGAQGVFAAAVDTESGSQPYTLAGMRAFRNFDGQNSNFGDTAVAAVSDDVEDVMVYAATDSTQAGRVVYVAINRSFASQVVQIKGQTLSGAARLYQMTADSAASQTAGAQATIAPIAAGSVVVAGTSLVVTLPALSVTTIDIH